VTEAEPTTDGPAARFERDSVEFNRIVNLTDGVAAIALTLLVLALEVPSPVGPSSEADMGAVLDELGTPIFAFLLSFVIIASSWYKHHRFVAQLRGLDGAMVVWNFSYLLVLVIVPFASDLIGTYGDNPQAVAIYAAIMTMLYVVAVPGYELARARGLLPLEVAPGQTSGRRLGQLVPAACFAVSIPLVLITENPSVAYWTWVAIWPIVQLTERLNDGIAARSAPTSG
jgi:uncharacterized membrane protein